MSLTVLFIYFFFQFENLVESDEVSLDFTS